MSDETKTAAMQQTFVLTPDAAAEMLIGLFGQNGYTAGSVWFEAQADRLVCVRVVCESPKFEVRTVPEPSQTLAQKRAEYVDLLVPVGGSENGTD